MTDESVRVEPCPACGEPVDVLGCFDAYQCVACGRDINELQAIARGEDPSQVEPAEPPTVDSEVRARV